MVLPGWQQQMSPHRIDAVPGNRTKHLGERKNLQGVSLATLKKGPRDRIFR
jgi:hypothetical protein